MTIIGRMGSLDFTEAIGAAREEEQRTHNLRSRRAQIKAQALAQVCAINRCGVNELTPAMRAYAEAIERRMLGEGDTAGKGYGFSLPGVAERRPNQR